MTTPTPTPRPGPKRPPPVGGANSVPGRVNYPGNGGSPNLGNAIAARLCPKGFELKSLYKKELPGDSVLDDIVGLFPWNWGKNTESAGPMEVVCVTSDNIMDPD